MAAKPPMPKGEIAASAPPHTITSASPYSIMRALVPMACSPVVQAVTMAILGPLKPNLIDTWPEIMLMMLAGMKNGVIRRGPRLVSSVCVSSIMAKPPMPEPMLQPIRTALSWSKASPTGKPHLAPLAPQQQSHSA